MNCLVVKMISRLNWELKPWCDVIICLKWLFHTQYHTDTQTQHVGGGQLHRNETLSTAWLWTAGMMIIRFHQAQCPEVFEYLHHYRVMSCHWFYRWHWLTEAPWVMLACWGSVSLQGPLGLGRAAGRVVETSEGMEAHLLEVEAAPSLLEDWVLVLKIKMRLVISTN